MTNRPEFGAQSKKFSDQLGSATGEFVLVALPLFLPALLFFLAMSHISRSEMESSFIAREAVRAFTTGSDDQAAHARVKALLGEYNKSNLSYRVVCSTQPCISPGAEVELSVFELQGGELYSENSMSAGFSGGSKGTNLERTIVATARGFVDKWQ